MEVTLGLGQAQSTAVSHGSRALLTLLQSAERGLKPSGASEAFHDAALTLDADPSGARAGAGQVKLHPGSCQRCFQA